MRLTIKRIGQVKPRIRFLADSVVLDGGSTKSVVLSFGDSFGGPSLRLSSRNLSIRTLLQTPVIRYSFVFIPRVTPSRCTEDLPCLHIRCLWHCSNSDRFIRINLRRLWFSAWCAIGLVVQLQDHKLSGYLTLLRILRLD